MPAPEKEGGVLVVAAALLAPPAHGGVNTKGRSKTAATKKFVIK